MISKEFLAPKHTGMMVSSEGLIGRIRDGRERANKGNRYLLGCMLEHLKEMANRFYSGDIKAVDEFCQLYCLDDNRPKETSGSLPAHSGNCKPDSQPTKQ